MTWPLQPSRSTRLLITSVAVISVVTVCRLLLAVTFGLRADYFLSPHSTAGAPDYSLVDRQVSTDAVRRAWLNDLPPAFRVRWYGYLSIDEPRDYTFGLLSDDGSTLTVDGQRIIDNSGVHGASLQVNPVHLAAGSHAVLIEYMQAGGEYAVDWLWSPSGGALTPVPASLLSVGRSDAWKLRLARLLDWFALIATLGTVACAAHAIGWAGARRLGRTVGAQPRAASLCLFALLAVVETWPLAQHPSRLSRNDNRDTVLNEWAISWVAHQAVRAPLQLYDANIFYPERDTLARSEALIVQSAFAAPVLWLGGSPVLAYNLVLMAGFALTGWTMSLVLARWTGSWTAALTGGVIFAFNAHTFTRMPHLQAQHVEFLPLALGALDGLLRQPGLRQAARLACWVALQALTSVYLLVITAAALTAAVLVRPADWLNRRFVPVLGGLAIAGALTAVMLLPFFAPYIRLEASGGLSRTLAEATGLAAGLGNYLSTPARLHYDAWSYRWFAGDALFPGALALALSGVAFVRGVAFKDPRARMCLALGLAGVYLSFGPYAPGYRVLYALVPLLHAIRGVSRFGYLIMPAVAVLAAFGVKELQNLARSPRAGAAIAILPLLVALEVSPAPVSYTRFEGIAPIYQRLRDEPGAVVAELPFWGMGAEFLHANYMLNSTLHWRPMINGYSGFQGPSFRRYVETLAAFPDARSVEELRNAGVTHVVVHRASYAPGALAALDRWPGIARVADDDEVVLYRLQPGAGT